MEQAGQIDRNQDGSHDFRSGTASADSPDIVDDQGHAFKRGRVAERDEEEEQSVG